METKWLTKWLSTKWKQSCYKSNKIKLESKILKIKYNYLNKEEL